LTQTGSGVLTLQSSSNCYTGGTTIKCGGIQLGGLGGLLPVLASSAAGGLGGAVTITAGTLDLNGQTQTIGALNGSASALITDTQSGGGGPGSNGITPLTVDLDSGSSTYGGTIADGPTADISLTKEGAGTLVLSGTNSYSGGTTVAAGTLILNDSGALADGTSLTVGDASAFASTVAPAASSGVTTVPEPGTLWLAILGMLLVSVLLPSALGRATDYTKHGVSQCPSSD
jgi:autotransporter-associated beta strand protein